MFRRIVFPRESYMNDIFETRRSEFRPPGKVCLLFVAESRPAGGTFFYNADSNLYRYTLRVFENAFGKRWEAGDYFLNFFRDHGCYLDDLCAEPVNDLKKDEVAKRREHHEAGVGALSKRIRLYSPHVLITIKKDIAKHVRKAAQLAGFDNIPHYALPFPAMHWQSIFARQLTEILSLEPVRKCMKIS
jgi:hypothetical protein